jgi:hypothetical protein
MMSEMVISFRRGDEEPQAGCLHWGDGVAGSRKARAARRRKRRMDRVGHDLTDAQRYTLGNIVPVCRSCNASKCNAEVTGWLRRRRLDERAFLLRHLEINPGLARQFQGPDAQ